MVTDGAPEAQARTALANLVTDARKARALHNDLRVAEVHRSMNAVLDGMNLHADVPPAVSQH